MGRSKFPGKPSKHGNRTRVNVLAAMSAIPLVNNGSTTNASGSSSQGSANTNGTTATTSDNNTSEEQDERHSSSASEQERRVLQIQPKSVEEESTTTRKTKKSPTKKKKLIIKRSPLKTKRTRLIAKTNTTPLTRRHSLNGSFKEKRKENANLVGKFVLPCRSVHSSRVIKPNKRFITLEQETRIIRKRVKRQCNLKTEQEAATLVKTEVKTEEDDSVAITTPLKTVKMSLSSKEIDLGTSLANRNGKVVLRQARLQLSPTNRSAEGPFSATQTSPSRTITCAVCAAVRFYRFAKHARKFNVFSCESCRKFISKLIKRTTDPSTLTTKSPLTVLNCHKGQGLCHIPPNQRSSQLSAANQSSRCPACWLKLCLRAFQVPMALKTTLTQLLPKFMQPSEMSASTSPLFANSLNSLPLLTWQAAPETKEVFRTLSPTSNEQMTRQRSVRLERLKSFKEKLSAPLVEVKRAKIDLKGPRVKHVCRSASIVLGQLPATFTYDTNPRIKPDDYVTVNVKEELIELPIVKKTLDNEITVKKTEKSDSFAEVVQNKEKIKEPQPISTILEASSNLQVVKKEKLVEKPPKTAQISMLNMEYVTTKSSFNKRAQQMLPQMEDPNMLNIDFWENYDPDEIIGNGFSLMSSEAFPMRAICFLCGSAGKEPFIHCCICCEPYHPYCLEQGPPTFSKDEQKFSWVCPKCTTCSACGEADRQKINCQKCHKAYHPQCFNHKWRTDDRPTVCSNCLRCKSCGTDNITKFVGNLALCLACFKLRNKGNFCPLCQCCYDDNDFDIKMMECGKCNKWVHAKCEGLSDEQYQILSILPESVEFVCRLCTTEATPQWLRAVQQELRSCLNNILRLMSKNRDAREMLKLSPLKMSTPQIRKLHSARLLKFVNEPETDTSIDNDLEHANVVFKNKIDFDDSFNNSNSSLNLNDSKLPMSPRLVQIKNKLNCNEYFSLREFNDNMEKAHATDSKLLEIYHGILKKVMPWFDPTVKEDFNTTLDSSRLDTTIAGYEEQKYCDLVIQMPQLLSDNRVCNLCKGIGDGLPESEARLLYCGQNEWVHSNCALWSSEVYEEIDGSLQNVQSAITRGRSIKCSECKQKGASVGCCLKGCYETYHFPCAQKSKCHFIADKTMYCRLHEAPTELNLIVNPSDFTIRRSVYIEVDTKKKKLCVKDRVKYMVGSLSVVSLGKVIPAVSDTIDAIIPVGFVCSRLFWSTTEPWKLVPYKITTSIFNSQSEVYIDRNFTVDHSLARQFVEKKLKEIHLWQKGDKESRDIYEFEDYEEPQNAGDILSPELTDAILEELPHDLLEGFSMQEVLKEYEELMNMEINCNDNISLNMNSGSDEAGTAKEFKRSKSEVFQKIEDKKDKLKPVNQRSCSLSWIQLDNTSPAMKKRKMAPSFMQIVQVDGACDSSGSECGSPSHETEDVWAPDSDVRCEKCHCTYRTKTSYERHLENCEAFTSESETEEILNTTTEESVIYESFSYQTTQQNQIQSTVMNTQTILESKTQTQTHVQDGIIYNYQSVKPGIAQTAPMVELNASQFCVNQINTTSANSYIPVDNTHNHSHAQVISHNNINQSLVEPMTLQSVPYAQDAYINLGQSNQAITIDPKVLAPVLHLQQNQWVRPVLPQKAKPRPVFNKPPQQQQHQQPRMMQMMPQNSSVVLQHIPTTSMLPFVDGSFQSSPGVQYVMAPQMPQVSTPQLVQLAENNFLSLMPNVQPTMIFQQPRMDAGQIMIDSNGSMIWAQPIQQPLYFGIETVQTTVMQSQQLLPTTMPGMLANSSYSATTQVFQTSKLEPVLDGSYVLVNQNHQVLNQNHGVPQMQQQNIQIKPVAAPPSIPPNIPISISVPVAPVPVTPVPVSVPQQQQHQLQQPLPSAFQHQQHITMPVTAWSSLDKPQLKPIQVVTSPVPTATANSIPSNTTNSITLPVAPFVPEQGIPMNIVTPTKKPAVQSSRPMSRVLPMQTSATPKRSVEPQHLNHTVEKNRITIVGDIVIKPKPIPVSISTIGTMQSPPDKIEVPLVITSTKTDEPKIVKQMNIKELTDLKEAKLVEATEKLFTINIETRKHLDIEEKSKDKEVLKLNKIPIVPLRPIKPKMHNNTSNIISANKENINDNNIQEYKFGKKQKTTSIYFKIESDDGFEYTAASLPQIWRKVFNEVQAARSEHNLPLLPDVALRAFNGLDILGLKTKGMRFLVEQLPDAVKCKQYKPLYHKPKDPYLFEDDEHEDCARRCIPYDNRRKKYDMFGWLSSKHRRLEMYDLDESLIKKNASSTMPMAMRFRQLKYISKFSVGVHRSDIHGRGLFALRDIESSEMVIEYTGEVIRSGLTDKREKTYNTKNIGCYMFRIDDNLVVDATMRGNAARFINHSCDPNCYSKVVEIIGHKHIIIFALRKIICGEELTYDYKFPFEEDKIPCSCGTRRCRKFLN